MKLNKEIQMRLLILLSLVGFLSPIQAQTYVSSAQTLDQDNETYILTQDITSGGTAFGISGNNITLDLNNFVITYNNASSGPGIVVEGSNNEIKNGYIIQGTNRSSNSPAVKLNGSSHTVSYLGIKVNGVINGREQNAAGVEIYSSRTSVHHVFIENNGETNSISYSPRGIHGRHRTTAGFTINDNIIVNSHIGINLEVTGLDTDNPEKSNIFNNNIQHIRSPGTKAPYGIQLAKSRNVDIFNNQIISDEGRGIMLDGWGQGVSRGTDFNNIYNNRIDVEYRVVATSGQYVENNVYGIRDRYSSGNNSFYDNRIMVNNEAGGITTGLFIGSDQTDPLMTNLNVNNNVIIIQDDVNSQASAIRYAVADQLSVTDNEYLADIFSIGDYAYHNRGGIGVLQELNNTEIVNTSYQPVKPGGLLLRKFFDSYVITWDDNNEVQTFEYVIYRDGSPLDISTRGGTFYVDTNVTGKHTYTVVAKNLNGDLSFESDPISTDNASTRWSIPSILIQ